MKLQVTHSLVGETTIAEEFAFARLYRAKRIGHPVPPSAARLLMEPPQRPAVKRPRRMPLRLLAERLGVGLNHLRHCVYRKGVDRGALEAQVTP